MNNDRFVTSNRLKITINLEKQNLDTFDNKILKDRTNSLCVFMFQESCLPLFCPTYSTWMGERCVPVVTKVYSKGIRLTLRSMSIEAVIPCPVNITKTKVLKPQDIARSKCLDFNWSHISVVAEYDETTCVTQALHIYLIKIFNKEKEFDFSQMLTTHATCIPSAWEILISGHWIPVNMSFTSGFVNGRIEPKSKYIAAPSDLQGAFNSLYRTYAITQMDYCKQVNT